MDERGFTEWVECVERPLLRSAYLLRGGFLDPDTVLYLVGPAD